MGFHSREFGLKQRIVLQSVNLYQEVSSSVSHIPQIMLSKVAHGDAGQIVVSVRVQ